MIDDDLGTDGHGSLTQKSILSRELAQASRNHEVPWIYQCGAKPCLLKKAVDFCAKIKSVIIQPIILICGNQWIKKYVDKNEEEI